MKWIKWFSEVGIDDVPSVGGKNASLGEMYQALKPKGVRLANGFAITANAYRYFITDVKDEVQRLLKGLDAQNTIQLQQCGQAVRHAIEAAKLPIDLEEEIAEAYTILHSSRSDGSPSTQTLDVAVRSSATAEDLPDASFAGQQETYLNVRGRAALMDTCRRCFASLFTDRAISYRQDKGFDHEKIALSIGVQEMVRSDLATSGVMFTVDTETGFRDVVLVNAAYGLGENVVQGSVNPDEYYVHKPMLKSGYSPIIQKTMGSKEFKLVYDMGGGKMVKNVPVAEELRTQYALSNEDILTLSRWACLIEDHYSAKRGKWTPMDLEWGKNGPNGELYILQARPETVQSQAATGVMEVHKMTHRGEVITTGRAVGDKVACGRVRVIQNVAHLEDVQHGDILVTDKTDPDWEPSMKRAAAIVTNRGGRTCHAAIISRELGLPAVVGCIDATDKLREIEGQQITVSCCEGDKGFVYRQALPFIVEKLDINKLSQKRPKTKMMMNIGNPGEVLSVASIPNDGCGLARLEFIISTHVKVHPLALINYTSFVKRSKGQMCPLQGGDSSQSTLTTDMMLYAQEAVRQMDAATRGHPSPDDKPNFFVDKLAEGVAMIAAAFYPKPVIVRLSDFKTNEYANLIGGRDFERFEENPMLGCRGASRYYSPGFRPAFQLECEAMCKVRKVMGFTNVKIMIPFCRTPDEGCKVIRQMEKYGLKRDGSQDSLEIYVMCEIPSNVLLADEFCDIFDGFSIGSNDLTQLTLGVDRDSSTVAHLFEERNPAVKKLIREVIEVAKQRGKKVGICGQAPSDFPDFAQFLVECGIDSMSLTPDAVLPTTMRVIETESSLESK
eukprot:GHVN01040879.1.p1 GENE.GHVN01040879.1~~GHVN01040879.1.p1  ORF type:complete len:840 (+),score=142.18 GHVN01040879.1:74-2593(+)